MTSKDGGRLEGAFDALWLGYVSVDAAWSAQKLPGRSPHGAARTLLSALRGCGADASKRRCECGSGPCGDDIGRRMDRSLGERDYRVPIPCKTISKRRAERLEVEKDTVSATAS